MRGSDAVIKEVEDYKNKKAELERKIDGHRRAQAQPARAGADDGPDLARPAGAALARPHDHDGDARIEIEGRAFNSQRRGQLHREPRQGAGVRRSRSLQDTESGSSRRTRLPSSSISSTQLAPAIGKPRRRRDASGWRQALPRCDAPGGARRRAAARPRARRGNTMAIKTGLEGKPWYFGAALGLLVGGDDLRRRLVVRSRADPRRDQLAASEQQLAELQRKIQEGRAAKQQLPQFREEVRSLELELDKLLRILPARRNTPELLRRIRAAGRAGRLRLPPVHPGATSTRTSTASGRSSSASTAATTTWRCSSTGSAASRASSTSKT